MMNEAAFLHPRLFGRNLTLATSLVICRIDLKRIWVHELDLQRSFHPPRHQMIPRQVEPMPGVFYFEGSPRGANAQ